MAATNPKDNSRKKGVATARRLQRQEDAVARQAAAAARSPQEQLQRLRERGITQGQEYERLIAKLSGGIQPDGTHDKHTATLPGFKIKSKKGKRNETS